MSAVPHAIPHLTVLPFVLTMAESAGYRMPSFAKYAVLAVVVLFPVYLATSWIVALY